MVEQRVEQNSNLTNENEKMSSPESASASASSSSSPSSSPLSSPTAKTSVEQQQQNNQNDIVTPKQALIFDNVCHYRSDSVFTKYSNSDNLNLDGFKNFVYLVLAISCGRLIFENIVTYGFKANPFRWITYVIHDPLSRPTFALFILLHIFPLLSLMLEKFYNSYLFGNQRAHQQRSGVTLYMYTATEEMIFTIIYCTLLATMLALPILVNVYYYCNPYLLSFICLLYSSHALKLYSYHQVNSWWRTGRMYGQSRLKLFNNTKLYAKVDDYVEHTLVEQSGENSANSSSLSSSNGTSPSSSPSPSPPTNLTLYPHNLTLANIFYFAYAPTLCYQINYPRRSKIDWYFVARCIFEYITLIELETVLFEQWIIVPLELNQFILSELFVSEFLLRWTKMSLGSIIIWLIGFYAMFQSLLNLTAELLRFGDREFYNDWWNAKTIGEFWRNWNIPVHRWCVRHVYKPLIIRGGYTPLVASVSIFFLSGLFHEYIISIPLRLFCVHFVVGMTGQTVLDFTTAGVQRTNRRLANAIVWLSLIFGQSLLILLYYNDLIGKLRAASTNSE